MKSSKEFGKSWNTAEAGVVTSPESCKDHHSHILFPAKAERYLTTSSQEGAEHAALDEKTCLCLDMEGKIQS